MTAERPDNDYTIRSLTRGLGVLKCFEGRESGLTATEIVKLTGLAMPTVYRIVRTLIAEGFLEEANGTLQLSLSLLRLARSAHDANPLVRQAERHLKELALTTSETVNLGTLVESKVLYLERLQSSSLVTARVQVGSALPAECSSMGKLLLAFLPEDEQSQVVGRLPFDRCRGPNAHRSADSLRADLVQIAARGWAMQNEELEHGLRSIAGPVRDSSGRVVAAVNIAVSAYRLSESDLVERHLPPLLECCDAISRGTY